MVCWAEGRALHTKKAEDVCLAIGFKGLVGQPFNLEQLVDSINGNAV